MPALKFKYLGILQVKNAVIARFRFVFQYIL